MARVFCVAAIRPVAARRNWPLLSRIDPCSLLADPRRLGVQPSNRSVSASSLCHGSRGTRRSLLDPAVRQNLAPWGQELAVNCMAHNPSARLLLPGGFPHCHRDHTRIRNRRKGSCPAVRCGRIEVLRLQYETRRSAHGKTRNRT
jgi:hypothetical protein